MPKFSSQIRTNKNPMIASGGRAVLATSNRTHRTCQPHAAGCIRAGPSARLGDAEPSGCAARPAAAGRGSCGDALEQLPGRGDANRGPPGKG